MRGRAFHLDIYPRYGKRVEQSSGIKRLLYRIIPRHTILPFWQELYAARVRFASRRVPGRYAGARELLVNLGAGDKGKPGWVNVDVLKLPNVNCVYDCRKKLPFPENSVKGIFCEHFFEHIDYTEEAPYFLSECHRVLMPGGVIRIIVPDLEKYLRAYCAGSWEEFGRIRPLVDGGRDRYFGNKYNTQMELVNVLFRQGHEHKFAYDFRTLAFLLDKYGFQNVKQQQFGESYMEELVIDTPDRATESLYVEGVK
ncbi:MAG TPA: methyltransferase domain-containing protein [Chloroflexia bacterium]